MFCQCISALLIVVGIGPLQAVSSLAAQAPSEAPREIAVVAKRFAFEPDTIEVTEGERVRLTVTSADGVHGLQIKKFRVNKLIPRGSTPVTIDFVAAEPGTYEILCSEDCGKGHHDMKGTLIVKARPKTR